MIVEVSTSAELRAAIKKGSIAKLLAGIFDLEIGGTDAPEIIVTAQAQLTLVARESSQPRVEAWGSSQPRVEAWGSSQPRVVARESSQPRVVARGSSQPRVVARESSQPRVEARESSQPRVEAWGSSQPRVEAWGSSQPRVEAWGSSQPRVEARGSSQPRVEAWGSSQPRVVARESSQPRVEAWGSSQPRVVARESSQPRVVARESSQPRVEAWGYVQLSVLGKVIAKCTAKVAILIQGAAKVEGGKQTTIELTSARDWCDYYGVRVERGIATVYKAVDDKYNSPRGANYAPGTRLEATDWDGGKQECGGGLHFSPSPAMARAFFPEATRFLACKVRLADFRTPQPTDGSPEKCKARACVVAAEVDEDGEVMA